MLKSRKSRKQVGWILGLVVFLLLLNLSYDLAMVASAVIVVSLSLAFDRRKLWAWVPALTVSLCFVYLIRDIYSGYNLFSLKIRGIMLFPVIAWTIMLMLWYLVVEPYFSHKVWWRKWFKNAMLFCLGLIVFEFIGYNILGVRLDAGLEYPGWPILNIFHSPWWMQVAYFLNGIIFIGLVVVIENRPGKPVK